MGAIEMLAGAQWISGPAYEYGPDDAGYYTREHRNHVLSREFELSADVSCGGEGDGASGGATGGVWLALAVLGYAKVRVNGRPLDDIELLGHWTRWTRAVYADAFDISSLVHPGANRIDIELGNGFYNPAPLTLFGKYNLRERLDEVGTPAVSCAIARVGEVVLKSEGSWSCASGGLLLNNVYLGEVRDLRERAVEPLPTQVRPNVYHLEENPVPPCRRMSHIEPVAVREAQGVLILDFGEMVEGFISLTCRAHEGDEVSLRFAETEVAGELRFESNVAGHVGRATPRGVCPGGPGAPMPAEERDAFICREGENAFENTFTYHSFRYVEVAGLAADALMSAAAVPVHNDVARVGSFACDNADFMALHDAALRTKLNNMHDVLEDCARERFGYGGDMVALAISNLFSFDIDGLLDKTLADMRRDQTERGGIPETAPFMGIGSNGPAYGEGPLLWQLAYPYLALQLDRYRDGADVLAREWAGIERFGDYLLSFDAAGLAPHCLGDHGSMLTGRDFKSGTPDKEFVGWCAILWALMCVAEAARRVGRDGERFDAAAEALRGEIRMRFTNEDGSFGEGTQTGLAFAGMLGIGNAERCAAELARDIADRGLVTCGIFGAMLTFELLGRHGHHGVLEAWLLRREHPSLLDMLASGSGALAEQFDDSLASLDHAMFSSYVQWFYQGLAGIWVDDDARACSRVHIAPYFSPYCRRVACTYETPRGEMAVGWTREGGMVKVEVRIPDGIDAKIDVPGARELERADDKRGTSLTYLVSEPAAFALDA